MPDPLLIESQMERWRQQHPKASESELKSFLEGMEVGVAVCADELRKIDMEFDDRAK